MDFGAHALREPFFAQSVQTLLSEHRADSARTALDAITTICHQLPSTPPAGFIFHISRCGSTVVSNALKAVRGTCVLAEAQPIDAMFTPYGTHPAWPFARDRFEASRGDLFGALMAIYCRRRPGAERGVVVKFTSTNLLGLALVRHLWPAVPIVVVIRDPIEVVVSNLVRPPSWAGRRDGQVTAALCGASGEPQPMPPHEFLARAIGAMCQAAVEHLSEPCAVVDHRRLGAAIWPDLLALFRIEASATDLAAIADMMQWQAKDRDRAQRYQDDSADKQRQASRDVREAVERWARPPYRQLQQRERI